MLNDISQNQIGEPDIYDDELVETHQCGKLSSIVKEIVGADTVALGDALIDIDEQCERIFKEHGESIFGHPEFCAVAGKQFIKSVVGQKARSGIKAIMSAYAESLKNGRFALVIEDSLTAKVGRGMHRAVKFLSPEDMLGIYERFDDDADTTARQRDMWRAAAGLLVGAMKSKNATRLCEIAQGQLIDIEVNSSTNQGAS